MGSLELYIKDINQKWQTTTFGQMQVGITTIIKINNNLRKVYGHLDMIILSQTKHNQELVEARECLGHHQDPLPSLVSHHKVNIQILDSILAFGTPATRAAPR